MTDDAVKLQAVLDAPDEDEPRLAYAAWSEAQGGELAVARAELIRKQIELDGLDPELVADGGAFLLKHRITQLTERYGRAWAQPMPEWVGRFSFMRGFIGWIEVSARNFLNYDQWIFAAAPVQHVDLTGVRDVDESLFDSPYLQKIRSLSMDRCGLYDLHLQLLAASPHVKNLRWLSVADNHLTLAGAEALARSRYMDDLLFAEFRSNPADPGERVGYEGDAVIASWMPQEGNELEERVGYQRWLHRDVVYGRWER